MGIEGSHAQVDHVGAVVEEPAVESVLGRKTGAGAAGTLVGSGRWMDVDEASASAVYLCDERAHERVVERQVAPLAVTAARRAGGQLRWLVVAHPGYR